MSCSDVPDDSPDRDVLTPAGCRKLLLVGEKAYAQLIKRGMPKLATANSYRHVRAQVLEWVAAESAGPAETKSHHD